MKNTVVAIAATITVLSLAGCSCNKQDQARGDVPEQNGQENEDLSYMEDPLYKLFVQADKFYADGEMDKVATLLSDALNGEEYVEYRPQLLQALVRTLLEKGDVEAAKERVRAAYKSGDENMATCVAGSIYFHYLNAGEGEAAVAWTDEVLSIETLPLRVRRSFIEWSFNAAIEADDGARIASSAEQLFAMAPANDATEILRRSIETLFSRNKLDVIKNILERASKSVTSDASTRNLLTVMRIRLLAAQGEWNELVASFDDVAALPDKELAYALRNSLPAALKAFNYATVDSICEKVLSIQGLGRISSGYAARQWLESASKADVTEVPERIEQLVNGGVMQPQDTASILIRHAYDDIDNPAFATPMKALAEKLLVSMPEDSRMSLRTTILDYSFILEDYDTALALLNDGIAGYDENWHKMAISKIKAHKALKEGRPLDAIAEFRVFMSVIQNSEEETTDPTTGIIHSREMILGRNAARIGEIYSKIPDEANAFAAYAEARDYYNKALERQPNEETKAVIEKELSAIPNKTAVIPQEETKAAVEKELSATQAQ